MKILNPLRKHSTKKSQNKKDAPAYPLLIDSCSAASQERFTLFLGLMLSVGLFFNILDPGGTTTEIPVVSDPLLCLEGIVVDVSPDSITISTDNESRTFTRENTPIETGESLSPETALTPEARLFPGSPVIVTYQESNRHKALLIKILDSGPHYRPDEIHEIAGTSPGVTGKTWQNMLTWREKSVQYARQYRGQLYVNGNPSSKKVYLTFDDGPDKKNTLQIMKILQENNAVATFFCTGLNMQAYPDVVRQLDSNGFAIGLHGWDHKSFAKMTSADLRHQIEQSNNILRSLTGKTTTLTRPPYGDINEPVIATLTSIDQKSYLWSIDTLDWAQKDPASILRTIQEYLRPGDIILMHCGDGQGLTAQILPEIIHYIRAQGYELAVLP